MDLITLKEIYKKFYNQNLKATRSILKIKERILLLKSKPNLKIHINKIKI